MLVPVTVVLRVPVAVMDVIGMITVRHGNMSAFWPVLVIVFLVCRMRSGLALVVVVLMTAVQVTIVYIIRVFAMGHRDVSAIRAMRVVVVSVDLMLCRHRLSFPSLPPRSHVPGKCRARSALTRGKESSTPQSAAVVGDRGLAWERRVPPSEKRRGSQPGAAHPSRPPALTPGEPCRVCQATGKAPFPALLGPSPYPGAALGGPSDGRRRDPLSRSLRPHLDTSTGLLCFGMLSADVTIDSASSAFAADRVSLRPRAGSARTRPAKASDR